MNSKVITLSLLFFRWGLLGCFNATFNSELFLKLHAPDSKSILSPGMRPVAFSALLCTNHSIHSAQLPVTVPSGRVPVTSFSVSVLYLVNLWFLDRIISLLFLVCFCFWKVVTWGIEQDGAGEA